MEELNPTHAKTMIDVGLWSRLPDELLDSTLPYLPVRDLCRFRSVCKRWNSLICTPEFGTLNCVTQNNASQGASLVARTYGYNSRTGDIIHSWSIFDLNARRWYNVKHDLPVYYKCGIPTFDGGLVCACVNAFTDEQRRTSTIGGNSIRIPLPQTLIVSNLFGGTIRVLPNPPLVGYMDLPYIDLKLVVDNTSQLTYKVFLTGSSYDFHRNIPGDDACMCVYESSTNQWRIARTLLQNSNLFTSFVPGVQSAWFRGLLYVFCVHCSTSSMNFYAHQGAQLYGYNFLEDAWEDTGVQFLETIKTSLFHNVCDLVVSDNRLFVVTQGLGYQPNKELPGPRLEQLAWLLDISEVSLAEKVLRMVVRLTPAQVYENFSIVPDTNHGYGDKIRAYGYGKSILLMCRCTGKAIEYNLVTGLWETLSPKPVKSLHSPNFRPRHLLSGYGKLMSGFLRLPNTPL